MPPAIAALLTLFVVVALVARDWLRNPGASSALWLPVLWLAVTGSRFVSQWLSLGSPQVYSFEDGSTTDAAYFGALIALGMIVLLRRNIDFGSLAQANVWLLLFLIYGLLSVSWSDYPFISFRRWTKTLGHPVMALIVVTDKTPVQALKIVLKRCTFVLLPFSVLLIKYFPEYGRVFDAYTGAPMNNGVALHKNGLGYICMVSGLFFVWELFQRRRDGRRSGTLLTDTLIAVGMLAGALWLLDKADSATSMVTLGVGAAAMILIFSGIVSGRALTAFIVFGIVFGWLAEYLFHVYEQVLHLLGKDPTLTDRTLLWADVLALQDNPILGTGFESFWLGPRLEVLWDKWWFRPNQAHNGYIETYLSLGYVGVFLMIAMILSVYVRIRRAFLVGSELAPFRLAVLIVVILYNFTEASFTGVHFIWTVFYLIAVEYPVPRPLAQRFELHGIGQRRGNHVSG